MRLITNHIPDMENEDMKIEETGSQIHVEETSVTTELEICEDNERKNHQTLSTVALGLDRTSAAPVYGSVAVNSSENVQFGNNTYFNGPVVIKQVVHTSQKGGVDNVSYTKTEGNGGLRTDKPHMKDAIEKRKKIEVKMWQFLLTIVISLVIIAAITTALLSLSRHTGSDYHINQDNIADGSNTSNNDPLQIAPFHLRMVARSEWLAQPVEKPLDVIKHPVPWVIIAHTAAENCSTQSECVLRVRLIQMFHMESRGWDDIGYNFLLGGDGSAYEGRGWEYVGAHTKGYNLFSIGIAFIGTFNKDPPTEKQLEACKKLLDLGVRLGKLAKDYKLFGHRQLWSTQSPGNKTYEIIKKWPHFTTNVTAALPKP